MVDDASCWLEDWLGLVIIDEYLWVVVSAGSDCVINIDTVTLHFMRLFDTHGQSWSIMANACKCWLMKASNDLSRSNLDI